VTGEATQDTAGPTDADYVNHYVEKVKGLEVELAAARRDWTRELADQQLRISQLVEERDRAMTAAEKAIHDGEVLLILHDTEKARAERAEDRAGRAERGERLTLTRIQGQLKDCQFSNEMLGLEIERAEAALERVTAAVHEDHCVNHEPPPDFESCMFPSCIRYRAALASLGEDLKTGTPEGSAQ
jgi:hypothetical protein